MTKAIPNETHIFALFYPALEQNRDMITISRTSAVFHRIVHVLRLAKGDRAVLFNQRIHADVTVQAIGDREILFSCSSWQPNTVYTPSITCLLPLLKRDAFEETLTGVTECGASAIQPVMTGKTTHKTADPERMERIIIAAAEQSKHYAFPALNAPQALPDALSACASHTRIVWCDPAGAPFMDVLSQLRTEKPNHIAVIVGPEGDLTADEKALLRATPSVVSMALTPTILRAPQAMILAVGALRSALKNY